MKAERCVLYVDDVETNLRAFRRVFSSDFKVLTASTASEGLVQLRSHRVDVVLSDQQMPLVSGTSFLKQVAAEFPHVIRCLVSAHRDLESGIEAVNVARAYHYFTKPWKEAEVRSVLDRACVAAALSRGDGTDASEPSARPDASTSGEAWFLALFESSLDAVLVLNGEGVIELANPATKAILGYEVGSLLGKVVEFIVPSSLPTNLLASSLGDGSHLVYSVYGKHLRGHDVPLSVTLNAMRQTSGVRILVTLRDLSFQRDAEARVEASDVARVRAERANRAKDAFLAGMSHEIRTPLNAVLGFAQLLRRDAALSKEGVRHAEGIETAGRHLLRLINDVLEMSKIESGPSELRNTTFNPQEMIEDVINMFDAQAAEKGIEMRSEVVPGTPTRVIADGLKLRQVLINLLGNAVKFTDVGRIVAFVRAGAMKGDTCLLNFQIVDTGPGIAQSEIEYVFEKFSQTEEGLKRPGTGLGLSISREYARLMGGDLKMDSVVGQGTCFQLTVPVTWVDYTAPLTQPPLAGFPVGLEDGSEEVRALIVDDVADNREILAELLASVGLTCLQAASAEEALRVFADFAPHALLTDLRMPEMDGWELIDRVRKMPGGKDMTILAISASAFEESRQAALDAGADAFIAKPFQDTDVFGSLSRYAGVRFKYEGTPQGPQLPLGAGERSVERLVGGIQENLLSAAKAGDLDALVSLAEGLDDKSLKEMILARTQRYDYDSIIDMLKGRHGGI